MTSSAQSFVSVASTVLLALLVLPTLLQAAPNTRNDDPKRQSIVFNVWEFARVAGPRFTTTTTTTTLGPLESDDFVEPETPSVSPCVWAITSCCHAKDIGRRNKCFEALGCPGAWFDNLCARQHLESALLLISA